MSREFERDPNLELGSLFFLLFLAYFIPSTLGFSFPSVVLLWALLFFWLLLCVPAAVWAWGGLVWYFLLFFYLLSYIADINGLASLDNLRSIATSTVFSISGLALVSGRRRIIRSIFSYSLQRGIHFWGSVLVAVYCVFSIASFQSQGLVDTRDLSSANYLTNSDLIAMFGLATLYRKEMTGFSFVLIACSVAIALVMLGSRSAMALFGFCLALTYFRRFSAKKIIVMSLVTLPPVIYLVYQFVDLEADVFYRLRTLIDFSDDDASLTYRENLSVQFWNQINEVPQCLFFACQPVAGDYIHNLLSVVQFFGLAGLLLLPVLTLVLLLLAREILASRFFPLFLYCLLNLMFVRAWVALSFPPLIFLSVFFVMSYGNGFVRRFRRFGVNIE